MLKTKPLPELYRVNIYATSKRCCYCQHSKWNGDLLFCKQRDETINHKSNIGIGVNRQWDIVCDLHVWSDSIIEFTQREIELTETHKRLYGR